MCLISETIETSAKSKNALLRPLVFKIDRLVLMDKVVAFLDENGFIVGAVSKDFSEIFASDSRYEYTFIFLQDRSQTILDVILFTESDKFNKKKHLLTLMKKLKDSLGDYL